MYKKWLFIAWLTTLSIIHNKASGQTYNKIISDKEYYDFINNDILSDSFKIVHHVFRNRIKLDRNLLYYKDSADFEKKNLPEFIFYRRTYEGQILSNHLDTIFTRADIDFFGDQLNATKKIKVWKKPFNNSILIDSPEYNYNEQGLTGREMKFAVWGYSLPLFSLNRNYALVIKSTSIDEAHYVYKRNDQGGWDFVKKFQAWALHF